MSIRQLCGQGCHKSQWNQTRGASCWGCFFGRMKRGKKKKKMRRRRISASFAHDDSSYRWWRFLNEISFQQKWNIDYCLGSTGSTIMSECWGNDLDVNIYTSTTGYTMEYIKKQEVFWCQAWIVECSLTSTVCGMWSCQIWRWWQPGTDYLCLCLCWVGW